jgi:transcriptional regulator with XRE-family HTH domain
MSALLVTLRGDLTQTKAARRTGLTQSKISRAERGLFPLDAAEAERYARALNASTPQRRRLIALADAFAETNIVTRAALSRSARSIQERVGDLERESTLIRSWQPEIIPGILQTPAYTAAVVGRDPGEEWLTARAARLARLNEPGRRWHQLISEGALRWPLGSREVMVNQLESLAEASRTSHVRVGIVDFASFKPIAPPAAFHLYGRRVACVATETATAFLRAPHDIDHYAALHGQLERLAVYDEDARKLITDVWTDFMRMEK